MERTRIRSENDESHSNHCKEETDVENEKDAMFFKALICIQRELDTCDEKEGQTKLAQNIREIVKQVIPRESFSTRDSNGAPSKIYFHEEKFSTEICTKLVQSCSAEKALQIAVVVRHVLNNLDASSLLSLRLVCKTWEDEATLQLLTARHEKAFKIRFEWCASDGKYLHKKNERTLKDFHKDCGVNSRASVNARKFLCSQTKFVFEGGDLRSPLHHFFNKFGVSVRFLSLKPDYSDATRAQVDSTLHSILMDSTPNLHSLSFKSSWTERRQNQDQNQNQNQEPFEHQNFGKIGTGLEKLKVLKMYFFEKGPLGLVQRMRIEQLNSLGPLYRLHGAIQTSGINKITQKIMEHAPNLQLILDPDMIHTSQIVAAGKFHCVKTLDLKFPPDNSHLFLEFAAARPKLTSLSLLKNVSMTRAPTPNPTAEEITALNSILRRSRSTLEHFHGVQQLKNSELTGIQLPTFPLVKKLCCPQPCGSSSRSSRVNGNGNANGRILPAGFELAHVFPNLSVLQFDHFLEDGRGNPFNFSGNSNALCSLQHLEFKVKWDFNPMWMDKISFFYPNLNSLHVKILKNDSLFPLVCKSLWISLTQLKVLHLTLDFNLDALSNPQGNGAENEDKENEERSFRDEMDSIFTGFSLQSCKALKDQENSKLTAKKDVVSLEKLREFPSILDMKNLTEFKISCGKTNPEKLWSHVTEIHAFEKMRLKKNVNVQITRI